MNSYLIGMSWLIHIFCYSLSVVLLMFMLFRWVNFFRVCILQILDTHNKVAEKTEIYAPYNILPLDPDSANQAIMRYPEVHLGCDTHLSYTCLEIVLLFRNLLKGYRPFRSKLQWSPYVILEAFLGLRTTRKSKMKTYWIGSKRCLDFRCFLFFFVQYYPTILSLNSLLVNHVKSLVALIILLIQGNSLLMQFDMQKDNVANQREHLILLLANVHIRQFPKPDQQPKVIFNSQLCNSNRISFLETSLVIIVCLVWFLSSFNFSLLVFFLDNFWLKSLYCPWVSALTTQQYCYMLALVCTNHLFPLDIFNKIIWFQLDERALTEVMKKLFKSYKKWCKYLDRKSSLWSVFWSQSTVICLYDTWAI